MNEIKDCLNRIAGSLAYAQAREGEPARHEKKKENPLNCSIQAQQAFEK